MGIKKLTLSNYKTFFKNTRSQLIPSPMSVGKIEKSCKDTHIEWNISDFFSLLEDKTPLSTYYADFSWNNDSWYLILDTATEFLNLGLECKRSRNYSVEYCLGLKKRDGKVEHTVRGIMLGSDCEVYDDIINHSELSQKKSELVPSDVLTVVCIMKRKGTILLNRLYLRNLDTLSEDFKDLYDNKESCDTTLSVKGKEYSVHRAVLIARSTVFAATFRHDTTERQTGIINIPDCEAESFQKFLKYLYCGKLEKVSFHDALHLYSTSDKYDVQNLKGFCAEYLMQCVTAENLCDIIIFADKYNEADLFAVAQDFFNRNLNQVLNSSEWERLFKNNYRLANKLLKEMSSKMKFVN